MAISVDWPTKVINVPKADMLLIQSSPTEIRELDINQFRLDLRALEAGVEGLPFIETHNHNKPVTVGGVTLARVVEIINGYTVTFEDGQYAVNLVGANSNVADVTNVNQVSVRSANSAGLTYSKEIEDQSFIDGRVYIDTGMGSAGTQYPLGTITDPVSNATDGFAINDNRGLADRYLLKGAVTFSSEALDNHDWLGTTIPNDTINFGGSTAAGSHFERLKLSGAATGVYTARECILANVSGFNGFLFGGAIAGTLTLAAGEAHIVNVHAAAAGTNTVTIDCNGVDVDVFLPGWEGGLIISNHSHANAETAIDAKSGNVTIDSSCTAGTIVVRGVAMLTDNSGAGCTVITDGLIESEIIDFIRNVIEADEEYSATTAIKKLKGTSTILVQKNVSGGSVANPPIRLTE